MKKVSEQLNTLFPINESSGLEKYFVLTFEAMGVHLADSVSTSEPLAAAAHDNKLHLHGGGGSQKDKNLQTDVFFGLLRKKAHLSETSDTEGGAQDYLLAS